MAITWQNVNQDTSKNVLALNQAYQNQTAAMNTLGKGIDTIGSGYIKDAVTSLEDRYVAQLATLDNYRSVRDGKADAQMEIANASSLFDRSKLNTAYAGREAELLAKARTDLSNEFNSNLNQDNYADALGVVGDNTDILDNYAELEGTARKGMKAYQGEKLTGAFDQLLFDQNLTGAADLARQSGDMMPDAVNKLQSVKTARGLQLQDEFGKLMLANKYEEAEQLAKSSGDTMPDANGKLQDVKTAKGLQLQDAYGRLMLENRHIEAKQLAENNSNIMPDHVNKMREAEIARKDYDYNNIIHYMSDPDYAKRLSESMLSPEDRAEIEKHRDENGNLDLENLDRGTFDRLERTALLARDKGAMLTVVKKELSGNKDLTEERKAFLTKHAEERITEATELNTFNKETLAKWEQRELSHPDLVNNVFIRSENVPRDNVGINEAIGEVTTTLMNMKDNFKLSDSEIRSAGRAIMMLSNGTYLGKDGKYEGLAIPMDASMVKAVIAAVPEITKWGGSDDSVAEAFVTAMGLDKQAERYISYRERRENESAALRLTQGTQLPYAKEGKELQTHKTKAANYLKTLQAEMDDHLARKNAPFSPDKVSEKEKEELFKNPPKAISNTDSFDAQVAALSTAIATAGGRNPHIVTYNGATVENPTEQLTNLYVDYLSTLSEDEKLQFASQYGGKLNRLGEAIHYGATSTGSGIATAMSYFPLFAAVGAGMDNTQKIVANEAKYGGIPKGVSEGVDYLAKLIDLPTASKKAADTNERVYKQNKANMDALRRAIDLTR